jgi:hypothetical protein
MFRTAIIVLGLLLSLVELVAGADIVLAGGGLSPAPIVVYEGAPPRTREAAGVLADYIQKISGQRPEIIDGEPGRLPDRALWVGVQPAVKRLFPGMDFEFQHPEEIVIAANDGHVVVAGRDRWDPERLDVVTRYGTVKGKQQEYGTVNAVYTFLQEQLGVRWLWPGELGEDVVKRDAIRLAPMAYRYHPQIRSRGGAFVFSTLGNKGYGRAHEWTLRQRLQLDSLETAGGHAFSSWWERHQKQHPEIFALQPDGTRSAFPTPKHAKLCISNPKVWQLWLEDVAQDLAGDPNRKVFNASPNDGWMSGHCVCDKCKSWDPPEGEPRRYNWHKHSAEGPAMSDRDVKFANTLAALLEQKYPGKGYRVEMLSYGNSRPVPARERPADNVIMSIVANFFGRKGLVDRGSLRNETYRQQFEAWAKIVPSMLWRPNTGSPAGWQQGLPDLSIQQTIQDLKDVAAANCEGIFIDSVWEHWATQGPQYYVMSQLIWNPALDGETVLKDYYERAFGSAAPTVRAYFEKLEQARMAFTARNGEAGPLTFPQLYSAALLQECRELLRAAAAAAPDGSLHRQRVAFVQAGLEFTQLMVSTIELMDGYWTNKNPEIAAKAKANWTGMEQLCVQHPYAINWGPLRPNTPRMVGLHPDHPDPKRGRRKAKTVDDLDLN